ncbi:MAG: outer membrane beta-barrel protein [Bacteroidota bacterium]
MKRISFVAASLLLLSLFIYKPVQAQEGVKIGFRASPLIGWASVVDDSTKTKPDGLTTKAGLGFSFDFVFTYGFSDNIAFRTGVNIATKAVSNESVVDLSLFGGSANQTLVAKTNFTSVEVPIGLKFRSPEIGTGIYIVGHFGLNAEFNVQNRTTTDEVDILLTPPSVVVNSVERRDVDGLALFTASFVPGAGVDWEFDWGMLEFALTYHWGLLSFTDPDEFGNLRSRLNYLALNVGYFF